MEGRLVRGRQAIRLAAFVSLMLVALATLGSGVAGAQERDPFDPLVGESAGAATAPTGGAPVQPAPVQQPAPAQAPAEQLPATGAAAMPFVVVALALVCAGVGITIVSRCFGRQAALKAFGSAEPGR